MHKFVVLFLLLLDGGIEHHEHKRHLHRARRTHLTWKQRGIVNRLREWPESDGKTDDELLDSIEK